MDTIDKVFKLLLFLVFMSPFSNATFIGNLMGNKNAGKGEKIEKVTLPGRTTLIVEPDDKGHGYFVSVSDEKGIEKKTIVNLDSIQTLSQFPNQITSLENVDRVQVKGTSSNETNWFFVQTKASIVLFFKGDLGVEGFEIPNHPSELKDFSFSILKQTDSSRNTKRVILFSVRDILGQEKTYTLDYLNNTERMKPVLKVWADKYFQLEPVTVLAANQPFLLLKNTQLDPAVLMSKEGREIKTFASQAVTQTRAESKSFGIPELTKFVPIPDSINESAAAFLATLPPSQKHVDNANPNPVPTITSTPIVANFEIEHGNDKFQIYSMDLSQVRRNFPEIKEVELLQEKVGIYVQRKSDGVIVKLSSLPNLPSISGQTHGFKIEDGILSHPKLLRSIELDSREIELANGNKKSVDLFRLEAGYKPKSLGKMNTAEENTKDVEFVLQNFEDFRASSAGSMKPLPSRLTIVDAIVNQIFAGESVKINLSGDSTDKGLILALVAKLMPRTWYVPEFSYTSLGDIGTSGQLQVKMGHVSKAVQSVPMVFISPDFLSLSGLGATRESETDVLKLLAPSFKRGTPFNIITEINNPSDLTDRVEDSRITGGLSHIPVPDLSNAELIQYLSSFLKINFPKITIQKETLEYLIDKAASIKRVNPEPQRSENLLNAIAKKLMDENLNHFQAKQIDPIQIETIEIDRALTYYYGVSKHLSTEQGQIKTILEYMKRMHKNVKGHEHILAALEERLRIGLSGLHSSRGAMLMEWIDGPPGVGKTELAKAQADAMGVPLGRIDMNNYASGSGNSSNDLLAEIAKHIAKNPFSVILLDEVEKADFTVLQGLLMALSESSFQYTEKTSSGKSIVRKQTLYNATVKLTANTIGPEVLQWLNHKIKEDPNKYDNIKADELDAEFKKDVPEIAIKQHLVNFGIPAPLIDRLNIHIAYPASFDIMVEILEQKLSEIKKAVQKNGFQFILENPGLSENQIIRHYVRQFRDSGASVRDSINFFHKAVAGQAARVRELHSDYKAIKYFKIDPLIKTIRPVSNKCLIVYSFKN